MPNVITVGSKVAFEVFGRPGSGVVKGMGPGHFSSIAVGDRGIKVRTSTLRLV